jgi:hypothetical protein
LNNESDDLSITGVLWLCVCAFFLGMIVYSEYRSRKDDYDRTVSHLRRDNMDISTRVFMLEHPEKAEEIKRAMEGVPGRVVGGAL